MKQVFADKIDEAAAGARARPAHHEGAQSNAAELRAQADPGRSTTPTPARAPFPSIDSASDPHVLASQDVAPRDPARAAGPDRPPRRAAAHRRARRARARRGRRRPGSTSARRGSAPACVVVTSEPPGLDVTLDGQRTGLTTPAVLEDVLLSEPHTVTLGGPAVKEVTRAGAAAPGRLVARVHVRARLLARRDPDRERPPGRRDRLDDKPGGQDADHDPARCGSTSGTGSTSSSPATRSTSSWCCPRRTASASRAASREPSRGEGATGAVALTRGRHEARHRGRGGDPLDGAVHRPTRSSSAAAARSVTFRLADRNVSRRHARFLRANGAVLVEDLGSLTGTRVNGERITGRRKLREGDLVQIGDYDLALLAEAAASTPARRRRRRSPRRPAVGRAPTDAADGDARRDRPHAALDVPPPAPRRARAGARRRRAVRLRARRRGRRARARPRRGLGGGRAAPGPTPRRSLAPEARPAPLLPGRRPSRMSALSNARRRSSAISPRSAVREPALVRPLEQPHDPLHAADGERRVLRDLGRRARARPPPPSPAGRLGSRAPRRARSPRRSAAR